MGGAIWAGGSAVSELLCTQSCLIGYVVASRVVDLHADTRRSGGELYSCQERGGFSFVKQFYGFISSMSFLVAEVHLPEFIPSPFSFDRAIVGLEFIPSPFSFESGPGKNSPASLSFRERTWRKQSSMTATCYSDRFFFLVLFFIPYDFCRWDYTVLLVCKRGSWTVYTSIRAPEVGSTGVLGGESNKERAVVPDEPSISSSSRKELFHLQWQGDHGKMRVNADGSLSRTSSGAALPSSLRKRGTRCRPSTLLLVEQYIISKIRLSQHCLYMYITLSRPIFSARGAEDHYHIPKYEVSCIMYPRLRVGGRWGRL